ncbi:4'-phosphopantetheinyl transferase family protein [Thermocoleostomius sinensis]|uniref:4'-phosphopantetheinyl transferase superfamily protein n=1 Tax=Thermocoleostomius sinensis A174 TaxID=2016057 RepID=A0A9E8Z7T8_9CYAN|nr:4'-phosphopantetheinyl transferase superfamily protein [Thermocoleostomius sinensis]WAL58063.1 4'-phosphopantetheinyl transferase superfamily protein [Thermocoleostomius sinensis A174]
MHIWRAKLDCSTQQLEQFALLLSPDEQTRANRFRFPRDRQRFVAGRGILRLILSCYLPLAADQLEFSYSARGKPSLSSLQAATPLSFNVSHSHQIALYAITCNRLVGIDVEYNRPLQEMEQLAQRFFLPNEVALLNQCPIERRQALFFQLWTCKEAYLKATGEGLTGLKRVEITNLSDSIVAFAHNGHPTPNWSMMQFSPVVDYTAAIAIEGHPIPCMYYSLIQ